MSKNITALVIIAAACASDASSTLVDVESIEEQDEFVRALMNVRVAIPNPTTGEPAAVEVSAAAIANSMAHSCLATVPVGGCEVRDIPLAHTSSCAQRLCHTHLSLCVAHELLNLAAEVGTTDLNIGVPMLECDPLGAPSTCYNLCSDPVICASYALIPATAPPQSAATRAALGREAAKWAKHVLLEAGESMRQEAILNAGVCNNQLQNPVGAGSSYGESFAVSFVEAYNIIEDIIGEVETSTLAAASELRARFTDVGAASRLSQVAPMISQVSLGHFLVGGPEGYKADASAPICSSPPPTLKHRLAESYLRHAGISPNDLRSYNIDTILAGTLPSTSVAGRFDERYGLVGDNSLVGSGVSGIFERTGLSRSDFNHARERIIEDHRAGERSNSALMPTHHGSTTIPIYAATALPRGRSGLYSGLTADLRQAVPDNSVMDPAVAWLDDRTGTVPFANPVAPGRTYMVKSVAGALDYAISVAHELVSGTFPTAPAGTTRPVDILGSLRMTGMTTRPGRMEACYRYNSGTDHYRVRALGGWASGELRLVQGTDGLRCAVEGNVDGQPCDLSGFYIGGSPTTATTALRAVGFDRWVEWNVQYTNINTTLYLVRLKNGASPDTPGAYAELTSTHAPYANAPAPANTWQYCSLRPIIPDLDARAARAFARSSDVCAEPEQSCTLLPTDQRIPLEDELIDNSNAFEDSYRYLLNLARQAADEADLLGVESLRAGFDIEERAERNVDELERLCGVSVNVDTLFDPALLGFVGGACTAPAPGAPDPCGTAATCVSGRCTADPLKAALANLDDAAADRLRSCLQADTVEPRVSLGTEEVCVWHPSGVPNAVCAVDGLGGWTETACPYIASPGTTLMERCPLAPPGYERELVSTRLGLFDSRAGASGRGEPPCDAVRALSSQFGPTNLDERRRLLEEIRASNFFQIDNIRELARRLRWRPEPFDYSTIALDGRDFLSTGHPTIVTTNPGPEAPCRPSACTSYTDSLFCASINCTSNEQRATINRRLARAAYAARVSTGAGTSGMYVPYIPGWADSSVVGSSDVINLPNPGPSHAIVSNDVTFAARQNNRVCGRFGFICSDAQILHEADATGRAFCVPSGDIVWRDERGTQFPSHCQLEAPFFSVVNAGDAPGTNPLVASAFFWSGLASDSQPAGPTYGDAALYRWMRARLQAPEIRPGTPLANDLTGYWLSAAQISEIRTTRDCDDRCVSNLVGMALARALIPVPIFGPGWFSSDLEELSEDANKISFLASGLGARDLTDGAELLCEAGLEAANCSLADPPSISDPDDLASAAGYMDCVANRLLRNMGRTVLSNMPVGVLRSTTEYATTGAWPRTGGEMSNGVNEVAGALVQASSAAVAIAQHLRGLASDMRRFQRQIELSGISVQRADLQLLGEISSYQSACFAAASPSISIGAGGVGVSMNPGAALATCANSYAQIDIGRQVNNLTRRQLGLEEDQAFDDFRDSFENRTVALTEQANSLRTAILGVETGLSSLEIKRFEANRALSRAMLMDSDAMGRQYGANTFLRRRYNTAKLRYDRAFHRAKQLAFLARRAVEQRLGADLRTLNRDLRLVDRPSEWVDSLCAMSGVDYARARDGETVLTDARGEPVAHYAGEFIGDYVRKLERVVDGYRLAYPFQNAQDVAVVSLRDEVHRTRAECAVPSRNVIRNSDDLDAVGGVGAWSLTECEDAGDPSTRNCIRVSRISSPDSDRFEAYEVLFGREDPGVVVDPLTGVIADTTLTEDSAIHQDVDLEVGRYRLSWFASDVDAALPGELAVTLVATDGGTPPDLLDAATSATEDPTWFRHWQIFDVHPRAFSLVGRHAVRVSRVAPGEPQRVRLGGVMLERIDAFGDTLDASTFPPNRFAATDAQGMELRPECEDTRGVAFRRDAWRRGCDRLCNTGFGGACAPTDENTVCYWETVFTVTLDDLDRGRTVRTSGGFAAGNFNYRFDRIGVNLVGTALQSCEAAGLPSGCYASGNIPFSIRHEEPYHVRNHEGDTYSAPLFLGRIERARALAAERYVTNPISSADRALVDPYMRTEFRGRPLAGTYVLRVWETEAFRFERLEDVQLVIDYRYWTRFE